MKTLEIRTDILVKVFLTVILIFGLTNMSFSGSPGTYRKQIYEVAPQIKEVLKENNYKCTECFFYEPLSNGFVFNFYSIKSKKIIENIMQIGVDKYYENNKFIYIKFNFYKTPHANTNRPIFGIGGDTPMMSIELNNQKDKK
jgi:hypothetical protein